MDNQVVILQLKDLIRDRESFLTGDTDDDRIFLEDIEALKMAISMLEQQEQWIKEKTTSPSKMEQAYFKITKLEEEKQAQMDKIEELNDYIENLEHENKELDDKDKKIEELEKINETMAEEYLIHNPGMTRYLKEHYMLKKPLIDKLEEDIGKNIKQVGSYERNNALPWQERLIGSFDYAREILDILKGDKADE